MGRDSGRDTSRDTGRGKFTHIGCKMFLSRCLRDEETPGVQAHPLPVPSPPTIRVRARVRAWKGCRDVTC